MTLNAGLALFVNYLVPAFIVICSMFIGTASIKKWLSEPNNHEQIFYWGISFIIIGLAFANLLSCAVFDVGIKNCFVIRLWIVTAIWFQLFAIASIKTVTEQTRKKLRLVMWSSFIIILTTASLLATTSLEANQCASTGLLGVKLSEPVKAGLVFDLFYLVLTRAIISYLTPIRNFRYAYFSLYSAFVLFLMSRLTSIINTLVCDFNNVHLVYGEWALILAAFIYLVLSVYNLVIYNK